jgi:hypothetical protein
MKLLILGATGAAGSSLLEASLADARVTEVRTISRKPIATGAANHIGVVHDDLFDYAKVGDAFAGVDHCFFCVGRAVSQVKHPADYRLLVFTAPRVAARALNARSPAATFHYLSGAGASLQSRQMWARVKAEAEVELAKHVRVICWRPGAIDAKNTAGWPFFYKIVIPAMRVLAPSRKHYVTGEDLAVAMLAVAANGTTERTIENWQIRDLADAQRT